MNEIRISTRLTTTPTMYAEAVETAAKSTIVLYVLKFVSSTDHYKILTK